jgi:hypothetical protein
MTPKEKAKELVDKFIEHTKEWSEIDGYVIDKYRAKECALIAVEDMLKESVLPIISHRTDCYRTAEDFNKNFTHIKDQIDSFIISKYSYWQQVKREIIKL